MLWSHLLLPTCPLFLSIFLPAPLVSPPSSTASLCSSPAWAPVLTFYLKKPTAFYNKATEFRSGGRTAHKEKSFLEQREGHTVLLIINKSWEMRSANNKLREENCVIASLNPNCEEGGEETACLLLVALHHVAECLGKSWTSRPRLRCIKYPPSDTQTLEVRLKITRVLL